MIELIGYSFHSVNLVPTCLILLTLVYWIFVILGALDMGFLDFDLEADGEADIDLSADVEMEIDGSDIDGGISPMFTVLGFFNIGKIPIMLYITLLAMPMWFLAIVGNYYLGISSFILGLGTLIPNFFISLFIAKFISIPFVHLFRKISENDEDGFSPIGKKCVVKHETSSEKLGQVIITNSNGEEHIVNAKTYEGKMLRKGETGLVIEYIEEKQTYIIDPYEEI